jgi:uncharacterized protein (UPF0335 family)
MKKLKLKEGDAGFRTIGEIAERQAEVVAGIIDKAINPPEPDMLRPPLLEGHAKQKLKSYVERWERLESEKQALQTDQAEVLKEAESDGFDKAALTTLLKWRKKDADDIKHVLGIVEVYHDALDMDILPR